MAEKDAKTVQVDNLRDDDAAEKTEPAKGGGKPLPWLVLVVGFLVMLLTPAASYFVVKLSLPAAAPQEAGAKEAAAKKEAVKKTEVKEPTLLNLKSMLINVADTKGTRILKVTPHLVLSEPEMADKLNKLMTMLVDLITSVASSKTLDELDGPAGRENLKKDIVARVNKALETQQITGTVIDVYFDEFLIQ